MYRVVDIDKCRKIIELISSGMNDSDIVPICQTTINRVVATRRIYDYYKNEICFAELTNTELDELLSINLSKIKSVPGLEDYAMMDQAGAPREDLWRLYNNYEESIKTLLTNSSFKIELSKFETKKKIDSLIDSHFVPKMCVSVLEKKDGDICALGQSEVFVVSFYYPGSGYLTQYYYPCSSYTNFIDAHCRCFELLRGTPYSVSLLNMRPDNLNKIGFIKDYQEFLKGYGIILKRKLYMAESERKYLYKMQEKYNQELSKLKFDSYEEMNNFSDFWANKRTLMGSSITFKTAFDLLLSDKLREIPVINDYVSHIRDIVVDEQGIVSINGICYCLPKEYAGLTINAEITRDRIKIYRNFKKVCEYELDGKIIQHDSNNNESRKVYDRKQSIRPTEKYTRKSIEYNSEEVSS